MVCVRIVRSTLYEAVSVVGTADIYYLFNGLLLTLQVLHIIWFYFILLIARDAVFEGQVSHGPQWYGAALGLCWVGYTVVWGVLGDTGLH